MGDVFIGSGASLGQVSVGASFVSELGQVMINAGTSLLNLLMQFAPQLLVLVAIGLIFRFIYKLAKRGR